MNLLQMEFGVLPAKVLKEDKAEYIQALIDTREDENVDLFVDCMTKLHCQHLKSDMDQYVKTTAEEMVDKAALREEMVRKWSIFLHLWSTSVRSRQTTSLVNFVSRGLRPSVTCGNLLSSGTLRRMEATRTAATA